MVHELSFTKVGSIFLSASKTYIQNLIRPVNPLSTYNETIPTFNLIRVLNLSYNNKISSKSIKSMLHLLIEDMDIYDMELDDSNNYNKLLLHAFLCYCKA